MSPQPDPASEQLDDVFASLASRRRRIALCCVVAHRTLSLADLAELVVERETGRPIQELSAERTADAYLSLYHTHVPKLKDADLVQYDQERDVVSLSGDADPLYAAREELGDILEGATEGPSPPDA